MDEKYALLSLKLITGQHHDACTRNIQQKLTIIHSIMRKAPIWNHFILKTEPHGKFAVCNLCQAPLKYQNSTSSLQYHVKSKHKDKLKDLPIQKAQKHRLEDDDSAISSYC